MRRTAGRRVNSSRSFPYPAASTHQARLHRATGPAATARVASAPAPDTGPGRVRRQRSPRPAPVRRRGSRGCVPRAPRSSTCFFFFCFFFSMPLLRPVRSGAYPTRRHVVRGRRLGQRVIAVTLDGPCAALRQRERVGNRHRPNHRLARMVFTWNGVDGGLSENGRQAIAHGIGATSRAAARGFGRAGGRVRAGRGSGL